MSHARLQQRRRHTCTANKIKTTLLTQKEWVMTSWEYRKDSDPTWTDNFSSKAPCVKDDRFVFKTDGVFQQLDGTLKCSASDPNILATSSWNFSANETMISFAGGTAKTITVLDEQTFSISYTYMVNGVLHHAKESYGH